MNCPVCDCAQHHAFVTTRALMHAPNNEAYHFNRCADCETVFLTNPVGEERLSDYYTEHYLPYRGAEAWGKYRGFVEGSQRQLDRKRVNMVRRMLPHSKAFSLLDVGCGNPSFLKQAQASLNAACTGIDFTDEGWKNQEFPNLTLIKTSVEAFKPEATFDVITLWHYLEHDYHLHETVDKLYECLNPGGRVIIEVPDYQSWSARKQKHFWQGWHSPRHLTLFSKQGFEQLFDTQRWRMVKHLRYGTLDAFTLWWLGRLEAKQIDWRAPMVNEFWPLVRLKMATFPLFLLEKWMPMGVQLVVFEKKTDRAEDIPSTSGKSSL